MPDMTTTSRYEIKYLVPARRMDEIKRVLGGLLIPDANNVDDQGYYNHSIYFDSPRFDAYMEKHEGQSDRVKPRVRFYRPLIDGPPAAAFLELKKRDNRVIKKERQPVSLDLARQLLTRGPQQLDLGINGENGPGALGEFIYVSRRYGMVPAVTVLYHRSAYFSPIYPQVRLTFDRGIKCSLRTDMDVLGSSLAYALDPREMIVELKYNNQAPHLLLQRCRALGLTQVTFSKFAIALETSLDPLQQGRYFG